MLHIISLNSVLYKLSTTDSLYELIPFKHTEAFSLLRNCIPCWALLAGWWWHVHSKKFVIVDLSSGGSAQVWWGMIRRSRIQLQSLWDACNRRLKSTNWLVLCRSYWIVWRVPVHVLVNDIASSVDCFEQYAKGQGQSRWRGWLCCVNP